MVNATDPDQMPALNSLFETSSSIIAPRTKSVPAIMAVQVKYVNKEGEVVAAMDVPRDRYVHYAFEDAGVDVPIINRARMCRNGCCTTCAVRVKEGKVRIPRCTNGPLFFPVKTCCVVGWRQINGA